MQSVSIIGLDWNNECQPGDHHEKKESKCLVAAQKHYTQIMVELTGNVLKMSL